MANQINCVLKKITKRLTDEKTDENQIITLHYIYAKQEAVSKRGREKKAPKPKWQE